jgi:PAS domain S-box-containing protein
MAPSAEMLQAILDGLTVAVIVTDTENNIVVFNRAAGEMLGQDPAARIGSSAMRCHPEQSEPAVQRMIDDLRNRVYGPYNGWVNFQGHGVYEYISPLFDGQGRWAGTLVEVHDAADKAEYLRRLGEWTGAWAEGVGDHAPRSPHAEQALAHQAT